MSNNLQIDPHQSSQNTIKRDENLEIIKNDDFTKNKNLEEVAQKESENLVAQTNEKTPKKASKKDEEDKENKENLVVKMAQMQRLIGFLNILCLVLILVCGVLFAQNFRNRGFLNFGNNFGNSPDISKLENQVKILIDENFLFGKPDQNKQNIGKLKGLVLSLDDPYSEFLSKEDVEKAQNRLNNRYEGVGIQFSFGSQIKIQKILKNSPAMQSDLRIGDELVKVDEVLVSSIAIKDLAEKVRGKPGTTVKLEVKRGEEKLVKEIKRAQIIGELIELEVRGNVGIITISSFGDKLGTKMAQIAEEITKNKQIKSLIIDIRGNGGGLLDQTIELASYFLPEKTLIVQEKSKERTQKLYSTAKNPNLANFPLKVLIDANSASASEILAATLRDNRQIELIGQKSFGKGIVQQIFDLGENKLKLTVEEWLTPKGNQIHKIGLTPDKIVPEKEDSLEFALKN